MLEVLVIVVALGGLELILWYFDHRQQKKQIELLDSIWAELAIRNVTEEPPNKAATRNHPVAAGDTRQLADAAPDEGLVVTRERMT